MKKILIISLLMLLARCEEHIPTTQALSVIVDATDGENKEVSYERIQGYLKKGHPSDGLLISLRYVSDTRYAPSYEFELPTGDVGLLSNEDTRRRKRRMLLKSFRDTLENTKRKLSSRSEIFRLVTEEANRLSKTGCSGSLLVYSDLKENSFFSVYNPRDREMLLKNPSDVAERFLDVEALPENLSGITVYVLHTPSLEDSEVFTAMVGVYRSLLESRGAKILVTRTKRVHIKP